MIQQNDGQAIEVNILRNSDHQLTKTYQVLREFIVNEQHYCLLRSEDDHPDDCFLYRVSEDQLEEIEDEMEWEHISEAIDEYLFYSDS